MVVAALLTVIGLITAVGGIGVFAAFVALTKSSRRIQ